MLKKTELKRAVKGLVPMKLWNARRTASIIRQHKNVAAFWIPVIEAYYNEEIGSYSLKPKKELDTQKVIWQYWGQGMDKDCLPEIVQICFDSVDRNRGDYRVIRLTDTTVSEYIDLPDFVWRKRENSQFTRTLFSDLLRIALLSVYGGVWLDATILLTGGLPDTYGKYDFFMFQRSEEEKNKKYWEGVYAYYFGWRTDFKVKVLNSIIFAQKDSLVISTLKDLLLYFWETQDSIPDYFFFQILFDELITKRLSNKNCPVINDCIPHIIQTKINGKYEEVSFGEALKLTNIHKMAYFDDAGIMRLKTILKQNRRV
ncbi:capsular polysaccharide synthesis protein [Bacteroides thetaiotaomicron]|uniref:capsular polysaccharide synthesis protein n=1 Tax=Bacteroides thetaiotaomicron TaxID=818 RepID=UPI001F424904|nr:capsular polysaccharide synthesis protein [Bacteroides thetaiotaomicron]MCE8953241.1 capsular polysaccharide synthesis protein [Bacteroides thetaiotaomicron]MCE8970748.1 capsular polysaccharide synthesis protein [Bacteroides thetaiotaomicron]MCS3194562.1 capsular polysaccharide synthesis protein [Bacteroides thetaiotaomicron]